MGDGAGKEPSESRLNIATGVEEYSRRRNRSGANRHQQDLLRGFEKDRMRLETNLKVIDS
jgi:hypothetical protein